MTGCVLLISKDDQVRRQVASACERLGTACEAVDDPPAATPLIEKAPSGIVLLDVDPDGERGLATFDRLRTDWPRLCIMLIARRAHSDQAIEAMKHGAIDYLLKPLQHDDLVNHLSGALRISRDMSVPTVYEERDLDVPGDRIIGQSPAMHEVFKLIGLIAPRDVNVLITGESGTGKELVARALYHHSRRKDHPFLAVNCAAIPETLLESELFGHERGAFTGADMRRIGKFEQCTGGTLFLDEIGDLPLPTQAKLLRVLQDGSFQRLGSAETVHCDVRIIAATNQELDRLIEERRFRQDLYYRLKVTSIVLPALRDREVDVVLLAHFFVRRFNPQIGSRIERFAPETLPALLNYPWPGNVRELENVIKASLVVARGNVFQAEFLPEHIRRPRGEPPAPALPPAAKDQASSKGDSWRQPFRVLCRRLLAEPHSHGHLYKTLLHLAEREVIIACLQHADGRLAPAARLLGVTRTTLRRRMTELEITVRAEVSGD